MIHFVGAGPGAPDLITLRGKALLEQADIVIYAGSLVNPVLLGFCRDTCRIYNSAHMYLQETLQVMYAADEEGLDLVRLHTGDPSLYGAVQEQADALRERGIAFDMTPGVSSLFAAAAALEREYTLPGISQTLIITRVEGRTPVPERERLTDLARHGASMVLFLSAGLTDRVQEALLQGSYRKDTPAAIVYKASWPEERILHCRLGNLHQTALDHQIRSTALLLVGDFLADRPAYENSRLYDPHFTTSYREARDS